jgi:hypothetical protein
MDNLQKQLAGSWTQAAGTVIAAIGSTPAIKISDDSRKDLGLIGNVLQATGNAVDADNQKQFTYGKLGNVIQAAGNITVSAGLTIRSDEEVTSEKLVISGDLIQALGAITALGSAGEIYMVLGNLLQAIGNALQALGTSRILKYGLNKEEKEINEVAIGIGSWIQALGTILLAIGLTQDIVQKTPD